MHLKIKGKLKAHNIFQQMAVKQTYLDISDGLISGNVNDMRLLGTHKQLHRGGF